MTNIAGSLPADRAPAIPGQPAALRRWLVTLGVLAVVSLVLEHGFRIEQKLVMWLHWFDVVLAAGFCAGLATEILTARRRQETLRQRRFELVVLAGFALGLALIALAPALLPAQPEDGTLMLGLVRIFLLANVCLQLLRGLQHIFALGIRTEVLLAGSFGALTLAGTLLLLLPRVSANPQKPITLLDAFFTATSAVCVTGLGVRDTATDFSSLGQVIILVLFQIGGLGIVTFVAFISAFSAKALPVPQMVAFREMINAPAMDDLKRRIVGILLLTAAIEGAGVVTLYAMAPGDDGLERLKWSVFHAVSAFCNAGFALHGTSLEFARTHAGINATIGLLIILGGLGFLVLPELIAMGVAHLRRVPLLFHPARRRFQPLRAGRLTVQTRISLRVTGWLLLVGLAGFWVLEGRFYLAEKPTHDAFLTSAFQSITTRTAGFNTVPIGELQQATLLFMIMLMVIGGCPVSTAGGIKTVTVGILLLALRSLISKKENVEAFGRTVPRRAFFTALNVAVLYLTTAGVGVLLLSVFDPHLALRDTLFETVSALSTVGLSTGITASLSPGSKLVLCVAMFIGRVGPIALVLAVIQSRGRVEYEFPQEDVVVG